MPSIPVSPPREGLEQDFNSLDAQREACEAYILSQKHEGWATLPVLYDDGGYSGGTLQRPGLQRLLADIAAGGVESSSSTRSTGSLGRCRTSPRSSRSSRDTPCPSSR